MQKGIKFRIYPNREQKNFIHQTLGLLPADLQPGTCHAQGKL